MIRLPVGKVSIDYDEEADVLYVSLKRPQKATDTQELANKGVLLRYREKELVGLSTSKVKSLSVHRTEPKKRSSSARAEDLSPLFLIRRRLLLCVRSPSLRRVNLTTSSGKRYRLAA